MFNPMFESNLYLAWFVGAGGALLGVLGLLFHTVLRKPRWPVAAPLFGILLSLAGATAALGQPRNVWGTALILSGVCGLFWGARSPWTSRTCARLLSLAGQPLVQWGSLLAASLVFTLGWTYHIDKQTGPTIDETALAKATVPEPKLQAVLPSPARTDRGRPVPVYTNPNFTPQVAAEETSLIANDGLAEEVIRIAPPDEAYDCHGWTFSGGRYWIKGQDVETILQDNGYRPVAVPQVNDLAVYRDEVGHIVHSGIVRVAEGKAGLILIESKWGRMGLFVHLPNKSCYGATCVYYHSNRPGHLLHGLEENPAGPNNAGVLARRGDGIS